MILSAFLKLDVAGFSSGLGIATEGLKALLRVGGDMGGKLKGAFDLGGAMSDLSAQIGESAGELLVLKQAFEDTGVGGDALAQTLGLMRRNLADLGGSATKADTLKRLGLDAAALSQMGAEEQLGAVGAAIRGLETPTDQAAAAMEIFGRSGVKMLTFLKDPAAIDTARASLGSLGDIIGDNANAFDAISDRIGRFKMKSMGLWAGVAEGLMPVVDTATRMFDGVDVAGFGRRIGETLGAIVELFRQNSLGDVLAAGLDAGWAGFLNGAVKGVLELGNILVTALQRPFAWISAAFQKAIEEMIEKVAAIPGVGDMLGIGGFKAASFDSMYQEQLSQRQNASKLMDEFLADWKPFTSEVSEETAAMWKNAVEGFRARIADIQGAAAGAVGADGEGGGGMFKVGGASALNVPTDRLTRIGGLMGKGSAPLADTKRDRMTERIMENTKKMSELLARNAIRNPVPAWG